MPPCPGIKFPELSILEILLKYEIIRSPIWLIKDKHKINKIRFIADWLLNELKFGYRFTNINPKIIENKKLPIIPVYVFFGLIFVIFGPLKILPQVKPPISVEIEIIIKNKNINKLIKNYFFLMEYAQ